MNTHTDTYVSASVEYTGMLLVVETMVLHKLRYLFVLSPSVQVPCSKLFDFECHLVISWELKAKRI